MVTYGKTDWFYREKRGGGWVNHPPSERDGPYNRNVHALCGAGVRKYWKVPKTAHRVRFVLTDTEHLNYDYLTLRYTPFANDPNFRWRYATVDRGHRGSWRLGIARSWLTGLIPDGNVKDVYVYVEYEERP